MQTDSKKVLITGASRGIGKNIALNFKEEGYLVVGTATSRLGVKEISKNGHIGIELNLDNNESIDAFLKIIDNDHQDINILINNAGITKDNILLRMREEEWLKVINIHLNGAFRITKKILKNMIKAKWGRVINISSTAASIGNKGQANYSAAKSGIEAFSRTVANEVGSRGITINSVAPGYIETDMTKNIDRKAKEEILERIPLSRFGKAEEVSDLILFLSSEEASYITGQTIHVNGGLFM